MAAEIYERRRYHKLPNSTRIEDIEPPSSGAVTPREVTKYSVPQMMSTATCQLGDGASPR